MDEAQKLLEGGATEAIDSPKEPAVVEKWSAQLTCWAGARCVCIRLLGPGEAKRNSEALFGFSSRAVCIVAPENALLALAPL